MHWLSDAVAWLWHGFQWLRSFADEQTLRTLSEQMGPALYLVLFAIVFSETGLLIGFFLPGDSLLFATGFVASTGGIRIELVIVLLSIAAVLGDAVNYLLGLRMDEYVFERGRIKFVKQEHLLAAKAFYERHGGKAIVLARFVPLVRTFTPFVAGVGRMSYRQFAVYNIIGGVAWVTLMSLAGWWLGSIEIVKKHFELVVTGIVVISVVPVIIAAGRAWLRAKKKGAAPSSATEPASATSPAE